ncbi:hypothetical protein GF420_11510 [candidate division GN15 bacterium]|nr:hypothetical protein [candidate division GN15 bacterium]
MIGAYKVLNRLVYHTTLPVLRWKAGQGHRLWRGRLMLDVPDKPVDIWIHAASAGEVRIAVVLVGYLKRVRPSVRVHLTVMTEAGYDVARDGLGNADSVSFFPLDVAPHIGRLFNILQPKALVIAETEIWPNLITGAAARSVPIVLINGRMSSQAFGRYKLSRGMFTHLLSLYDRHFLKSERDRERYAEFGVTDRTAVITGDMKFDAPLTPRSEGRRRELRYRIGVTDNAPVLVAGSTRPGEEALLLKTFRALKTTHPALRLVLAPRHVERLEEIEELIREAGLPILRYSDPQPSESTREPIILVDRMGILNDFYGAADVAFVGGTLVELGGHNLLEPVWAGTPVLYGPSIDNVAEAAQYIEEHRFGRRVTGSEELTEVLDAFLSGKLRFERKSEEDEDQTATAEVARYIAGLLDRKAADA